jgi:hypothetical protein
MLHVASPSAEATAWCKCFTRFSGIFRDRHDVRHAINELHRLLPPDLANTEQAMRLCEYG